MNRKQKSDIVVVVAGWVLSDLAVATVVAFAQFLCLHYFCVVLLHYLSLFLPTKQLQRQLQLLQVSFITDTETRIQNKHMLSDCDTYKYCT